MNIGLKQMNDITFGDSENYKEYSADGALCYPDGWSEFIKTLMEY